MPLSKDFTHLREGIRKVLELMDCKDGNGFTECRDLNFILNFPTGYGKTTLSIELAKWLSTHSTSNFSRLIHVVPTRSLVEDIAKRSASLKYAVQYSFAPSELRSPNFLARFVITTYDSFLLNLYKASVGEPFSVHGHYDLPRFSIYTSLVHFDEFHLMNEGNSWTSLIGAINHLSKTGVNFVLSSATPNRGLEEEVINNAKDVVKVSVVRNYGDSVKNRECRGLGEEGEYECNAGKAKYKVVEVKDEVKVPDIDVTFIDQGDFSKYIDGRTVIVVNTVDKAISIYEKLRDLNPCLIHSRFKVSDRKKIDLDECQLIISTQVIEVGVDMSSDVMITEQAPLPSIVQRVGRLLRRNEKEGGKLYIWTSGDYAPYDKSEVDSTLNALKGNDVCLKDPYGCYGKKGYAEVMDNIMTKPEINRRLFEELDKISINPFLTRKDLDYLLDKYCTLTNSFIINLAVDKPDSQEDLIPFNGEMVDKAPLEREGNKVLAFFEKYGSDGSTDKVEVVEGYIEFRDWKDLCRKYRKVTYDRKILLGLKVKREYYDSKKGLRLK
ncbi:CRISPR-associated helicase Cas3' [Sulfuracidifex tepidarius]|uniref:CRISPR-associated helicase Cas3 n=2 Tax=Sulfuracidifex tepidarius TaxID=1294262 RepID=A0A510E5P1_9CREN|nr:CRISPR-associated helicase Cas3' [Sulfuracidifex tepidarius]BBG27853.1 CRISPR-associated helicase Cas3 [Sulfuracidifex tepidarius]